MSERLHGLDYIRLVSFFAIATFHVSLIHYYTPAIDIAEQSVVIKATEQISRLLAFSGFTICFLSSLLTAFSGSSLKKRIRLFAFLIVGWATFSALMSTPEETWLVWDIYPLIFTGIMLCSIIQLRSEKLLRFFGVLGFCMLWIPFWDFREIVPLTGDLKIMFGFGQCPTDVVEWPVFPWIGLVFFGYWVGNELRHRWTEGDRDFFRMSKKETIFWAAALGASMLDVGNFYGIRLGQAFTCEAYRQPPLAWWSHFIWPLFFIRASFEPRVQSALARLPLSRFISGLAVSRKFWLVYFVNYVFCYVIDMLLVWSDVEKTEWNATVIAFIAVFLVPVTEVITRAMLWVAGQVRNLFASPGAGVVPEPSPTQSQSGASLMVVMIVIALLGFIVGGTTLMVRSKTDARMLRNAISGKQYALEILRQTAASPDVLRASKKNDILFQRCVEGNPSSGPVDCSAAATNPAGRSLILSVPYTAGVAPVNVTAASAGPTNAHYDWRGLRTPCTTADENCLYWASAQWWAECPGKAATCRQATKIYVIPQLNPFNVPKSNKRAVSNAKQQNLPTVNMISDEKAAIATGKPLKYAVMVTPTDIEGAIIQQCPTGAKMVGTTDDAGLKCECEQGYKKVSTDISTGWPSCMPMDYCPKGEILAGIDKDGKADCFKPQGVSFNCETRLTPSNGKVNCTPGYRMRQVTATDECHIATSNPNFEHVDCGAMRITCCAPK